MLPENLLSPSSVYRAGVAFLVIGSSIGVYFVLVRGITIAVILIFAILAIYFYSTSIVNAGLGELFVAIKGSMIVLGTFFVQTAQITAEPLYSGAIVGLLSASVLFVNSFPDYDADKSKGRRTLVIIMGRKRAAGFFPFFPAVIYVLIGLGITLNMTTYFSLICLAALPFAVRTGRILRRDHEDNAIMVPAMDSTVKFSRLAGALLALSFLIGI